jgi:hypothetical protein
MAINVGYFFIIILITSFSTMADDVEYYNQANSYQNQNDYQSAYEIYKDLANNGDVKSMLKIGEMYEFGMGMNTDIDIAYFWYDKAANLGYRTAIDKIKYLEKSQRNILINKKIIKSEYVESKPEPDIYSPTTERPAIQEKINSDSTDSISLSKNETKYDQIKKTKIDSSSTDNHWVFWLFIAIFSYFFIKSILLPALRIFSKVFHYIDSFLYNRNQYNIAVDLIKENLEELTIERRVGTVQGHFNKIDETSWIKKKDYFINKIIAERSGGGINYNNYIKIDKAIDRFTKNYGRVEMQRGGLSF